MSNMSKFSFRLSSTKVNELLIEFCQAICVMKEPEEAAHFLKDLLSKQEIMMLAKRLRIARLLIEGKKFDAIVQSLRVGMGTIARVSAWLQESGQGFRLVVKRTKRNPLDRASVAAMRDTTSEWRRFQRSHPMYFWPQLLLRDIIEGAPQRQRAKLLHTISIVKKAGYKTRLFRDLERLLRRASSS